MTTVKHYPKRLFSVLLAVIIALTLIPLQAARTVAASAEDSFTLTEDASGSGWSYSARTKTLTLDGAELTYSGSGSLFNFTEKDVNVVITGTNKIGLKDAAEGASVFSCPDGTIKIKSTGILDTNATTKRTTKNVYLVSAKTSVVIDGGCYYTNAFKAADENSTVTVNSGYVIITCLSDAGSKVIVNGGYIMGTYSRGDVVVKGGILSFTFDGSAPGFESGSLTCSSCIVETNGKIDESKCRVSGGENAVLIKDNNGIESYFTSTEIKTAPVDLSGEVTGGWLVNTNKSTDKHSTIKSGAKLKGAFYFCSGYVTVEADADLSEATLYIKSSTDEPALVIDGSSGAGSIPCGTICAENWSSADTADKLGIKINGPAEITGGNLIGMSNRGSGVDISADGGSISGTQIIGIPERINNSKNGSGVLLSKSLKADSTSSIIGNGEHFYYDYSAGGVVLGGGVQLPDCPITTNGKDGTDLIFDAPLKFDLVNGSNSPYGEFNPNYNCSGKGWKYFLNNFGEYNRFLPDAGGISRILVLDNLRYITNAANAAVEITDGAGIDGLVIVVKGECLLKNAGNGIISDISKPVLLVGYDENSKLSVRSEYKNKWADQPEYNVKYAVYTSGDLTIKNLTVDTKANAFLKQMIYSGNDLILMNSNITANLNPYKGDDELTALYSDNDLYIVGSNNFCFRQYAFESNKGSVYTGIFKRNYSNYQSHTADTYNKKIASGEDIKKITANEFGKTISTVPFDFNREKYNVTISGDMVTLTDKDPKVYYGDEPFEINADDFFVGGSEHYTLNSGSLSQIGNAKYDADKHIFSCTPINKDNDKFNVTVSYYNTIDKAKANILMGMPECVIVRYKFKVEMRPKINATFNAEGGDVTVNPEQVIKGSDSEVVVTPKEGWRVKSVKVDGTDVKLTDGKLQLTNIVNNTNVEVEFEVIPKYKVTVTTEGSGKVTPETSEFYEGSNAEFTVTPDEGYYIKSVTVDGNAVKLTDNKYTFNNITEEHTLAVKFEAIPKYKITVTTEGSGKVTPVTSEFYEGSSAEFTVTPDKGYYIKSVTVDGNAVELTDNKYTFNNITEEHTLSVVFDKIIMKYDLTVECGANGKASLTSMKDIEEGTVLSCVLTPDYGYEVKSVTLNGKALSVKDNKVSFTLNENSVLRIEFAKKSSSGAFNPSRPSRPSTPNDGNPSINGTQKSWAGLAADIAKLPVGSNVVINMNGETAVPVDVIKAIKDIKANVEFVADSTRSWIVNGANITAVSAADLSILLGNADKSGLRGAVGVDYKINGTGVPAELKLTFRKEFAGQFANVYKLVDNKLVFQGCYKIDETGAAVITGADIAGEYVVMVCEFSDKLGDMNNDGVLNALDAAAILKSIVGTAEKANPLMSDVDGNGTVDALDASAILKWIIAA